MSRHQSKLILNKKFKYFILEYALIQRDTFFWRYFYSDNVKTTTIDCFLYGKFFDTI